MRENLDATNGLVLAERVSFLLAERHGRARGHELAREAAERAVASGRSLADALADDDGLGIAGDELDAALDPTTYLGAAEALVDRALALYRSEQGGAS
jgi:3-carboxy-cis,cis-muconate cycloisomerase